MREVVYRLAGLRQLLLLLPLGIAVHHTILSLVGSLMSCCCSGVDTHPIIITSQGVKHIPNLSDLHCDLARTSPDCVVSNLTEAYGYGVPLHICSSRLKIHTQRSKEENDLWAVGSKLVGKM